MNQNPQTTSRLLTQNVKAGGCAAKMSSAELQEILAGLSFPGCANLLTGVENFEDAAVYQLTDDIAVVQTIDFFPPVVDDPYLFGQIAATNALSDVYAMGGKPVLALNVLCFPTCDFPIDVVREIIRGGAERIKAAGAVLAGGHSIQSPEPIYGLAVMGLIHPKKVLTNGGARAGDAIVLCKPIGTGVALLGLKADLLAEDGKSQLLGNLTMLNDVALRIALTHTITAATDVTGFGLLGHLHEMAKASGLKVCLFSERIPFLPQVVELAAQGFVPAGAYGNRNSFEQFAIYINDVNLPISDLLFDPQTSGGLLLSVPQDESEELVRKLNAEKIPGAVVGIFKTGDAGIVEVMTNG